MIDIDDTVVDMIPHWQIWAKNELDIDLQIDNSGFIDINLESQKLSIEWWKNDNLYQDKVPQEYSIEAINILRRYYDVYFCSTCMIEHKRSKEEFVSKFFKDIPLVDTHHKYLCKPDIIIDDKISVLHDAHNYNSSECIHKKNSINSKNKYPYLDKWIDIKEYLVNKI
jgi:5'(3')-deoxyribonucleotidase